MVNYIWTLCYKVHDDGLKDFIFDDTVTFGDTLKQRIYNIYHGVKEWPKCPSCGKKLPFMFFNKGYRKTCSSKCTCIMKYGSKSSLGCKAVREKARATMVKKYGDIYQKTQEYKDKVEATNLKRYGARHFMCTEDGVKKSQEAQIYKFGMLYQKTEDFHNLALKQYIEKKKKDKMAKGQRDAAYRRLLEYVDKEGFEALFSIDEYHAEHDADGKWNFYKFKCKKCGYEFSMMLGNIDRDGMTCPHCGKIGKSKIQHKLLLDIRKKYSELTFLEDYNKILDKHQEIDIYCEEKKVGIEYNGNCWHAQKFNNKRQDYHIKKYKNFCKNGIDIVSFWSDEFSKRKHLVDSIIEEMFIENDTNANRNIHIARLFDSVKAQQIFLTLVDSKDKIIAVYDNEDEMIGALKFKENGDDIVIDDLSSFKNFDFKSVVRMFVSLNEGKEVRFDLDNRLMAYYKKWIPENYALVRIKDPCFYKLRKGRSLKEYNRQLANDIDFTKEDIIWTYGRSIYEIRQNK